MLIIPLTFTHLTSTSSVPHRKLKFPGAPMQAQYRSYLLLTVLVFFLLSPSIAQKTSGQIPAPSEFLKIKVGADRQLADYHQISSYFKALAAASPRLEIEILGKTTLGEEMFMAVISSEENLRNKAKYKEIARQLADPRGLSPDQVSALASKGKSIFLLTCNIHSYEPGSSQMAMEWAYKLVTAQDPETERRLNDVIVLLVPSLNPDGQIMLAEWYRKYLGTKYEGGDTPFLEHHYAGHDANRDWYMLTQIETKNMNQAVYHEWFPQFWLDEHQMGFYGPRIYIPPNADPVAKLVNPLVHRGNNLIGADMGWRLEEAGKSGVIYNYSFDAYSPGTTRNTAWWKNMCGILTEIASVRMATPMQIAPTELEGGTKGLIEYEQQINFPHPWPGGTWRLRDIMDYELIVSDAALETMSKFRPDLLRGVASMAAEAVRSADAAEYWRIPLTGQRDPVTATRLAALMLEHGVEVFTSSDKQSFLIPTAQPYGRFVEEMFGIQRYPEVRLAPNSGILQPYDVTAWSLPLMMGVNADKVKLSEQERQSATVIKTVTWPSRGLSGSAAHYSIPATQNNVSSLINAVQKAGGDVYISKTPNRPPLAIFSANAKLADNAAKLHLHLEALSAMPQNAVQLKPVRVGLYKSYYPSIDEGWTRFILDQYGFGMKNIENKEVKAGNLNSKFDVIILPDSSKQIIVEGQPKGYFESFPPEYSGGIGKEGVSALKDFVEKGGTLIALAHANELLIGDDFNLPVRNAAGSEGERSGANPDFNVPGSLLRVYLNPNHPVGYGLPAEIAAFVDAPIAFQTSDPPPGVERSVIAWYPSDAKDILVSGYAQGAERLERKAAAVSFTKGKGKIVMFGFRVQHRAQTEGTFQLLFNAIYWGGLQQ
jgi:hypothetical protein